MRIHFTLFLVVAIAGCAQSGGSSDGGGDVARKNAIVQFTNMNVQPAVAEIQAGGNVVWTNMATGLNGVVSFPLSIESSFTCSELRPLFSKTASRLVSIPVTSDSENVTLPCALKPGEYEYQIDLFQAGQGGGGMVGMDNPQRTLNGKLVFE